MGLVVFEVILAFLKILGSIFSWDFSWLSIKLSAFFRSFNGGMFFNEDELVGLSVGVLNYEICF